MNPHSRAVAQELDRIHARNPLAPMVPCQHFFPRGAFQCSDCGAPVLNELP